MNRKVRLGDYVAVREQDEDGDVTEVLYQYIVSPDNERDGLIRTNQLGDYRCFDHEDGSNIYANSALKGFLDDWAAKQNFIFAEEVSLLELDSSRKAWEKNNNYVHSLRLSRGLGWFWTKTPYSVGAQGGVWYVYPDNFTYSSYAVNVNYVAHYLGVCPVLWLKPNISVGGGRGHRWGPHYVMLE